MKLTIDRKKWLRGTGDSFLLSPRDGKMCCLGFYALACGLTENDIRDQLTPVGVYKQHDKRMPEWLFGGIHGCSADGVKLMDVNDSEALVEWCALRQVIH
jgi:hypothetical protein